MRRCLAVTITTLVAIVALPTAGFAGTASRSAASRGRTVTAAALPRTPGTLITSKLVSAPGVTGTAYRVEYWSQSVPANKPVKVSGLVIVPNRAAPAGGWPVVSWAHPTDGMVGNCASSLDPTTDVPFVNNLLAKGWAVTASDYVHENAFVPSSRALLPFLVGTEAARDVIDVVRAARHVPAAHASANYLVWGWSEGGQAALFDSQIAESYAPDLNLKGVVAEAAPSQNTALVTSFVSNPLLWGLSLMVLAGIHAAYGNAAAPLHQILTPLGIKLITTVLKTEPHCIAGVFATLIGRYTRSEVFATSTIPPAWQTLLNENDPGRFSAAGRPPILIVHGSADQFVSSATSATLAAHLCALRPAQHLQRWLYLGLDHATVVGKQVSGTANANGNGGAVYTGSETIADIIRWMSDRFAGGAWPDPYTPTGNGMVTVARTNSC